MKGIPLDDLSLGVMGYSRQENERRLAIHPHHLSRIPAELRQRIYLEEGYGSGFGMSTDQMVQWVGGFRTRDELISQCDIILQPKPTLDDVTELREGQVLWGWPHCVQGRQLTQIAIDRRLTLIAFEAMNHRDQHGSPGVHVFHQNNELAGYCAVMHALQLAGITGNYGPRLRAAVIGFGSTGRGALLALRALGVHDVDVLTHRHTAAVAAPVHGPRLLRMVQTAEPGARNVENDGQTLPIAQFLTGHDIIVNCVLQDTDAPVTFLTHADLPHLRSGTLVIDVSCDRGMGFSWAQPTTFIEPTFEVSGKVRHYAVDHTPSLLWDSATWVISEALLPFIPVVLSGPDAWRADPVISRAIEIRDGVIQNPAILSFQGRSAQYPHSPLSS